MHTRIAVTIAVLLLATAAFAQDTIVPGPSDAFQLRYAANLAIGDSVINITNAGVLGPFRASSSNLCANVYVFDPDQQLVACCACKVSANALKSLSVRDDLISNTWTPGVPTSVTIKLIASKPIAGACDPSAVTAENLVAGMRAWGTTLHALPTTPVSYGVTETEFLNAPLATQEFARMTNYCSVAMTNGSDFGICRSCRSGGRAAVAQ